MQLKRFSIKGFKNFRQEVVLENMGYICVIHGENNIGKSNVLKAMECFFLILSEYEQYGYDNEGHYYPPVTPEELHGFSLNILNTLEANEIFTFGFNDPINMSLTFSCEENIEVTLDIFIPNKGIIEIKSHSQNELQETCLTHFEQAHVFIEHNANNSTTDKTVSLIGKTAPQCYVTSEGLVTLPEHVREELGVKQGGSIVILKRTNNHVELLTNEQFIGIVTAPQCYITSEGLVKLPKDICQELGIEQGGGIVPLKRNDNNHIQLLTNEQFSDLFEPIIDE